MRTVLGGWVNVNSDSWESRINSFLPSQKRIHQLIPIRTFLEIGQAIRVSGREEGRKEGIIVISAMISRFDDLEREGGRARAEGRGGMSAKQMRRR